MRTHTIHTLMLLLALVLPVRAGAQYYSVNVDLKTVTAMQGAYAAGAAAEALYDDRAGDVLGHYASAGLSSAGIFSTEYLRRRSMTDLGRLSSPTENYYYRRIYSMVATRIMPKIWTVGTMMLKSPHNALYWGSYLMDVCQQTKSLCMQFESAVTDATLSFSDITFLELSGEIADALTLYGMQGTDFRALLDAFATGTTLTREDLAADLARLTAQGAVSGLREGSASHGLVMGRASEAMDLAGSSGLLASVQQTLAATLLARLEEEGAGALFTSGAYDMDAWRDSYAPEDTSLCYRQRWYICRRDKGEELLCRYRPPEDTQAINSSAEWVRIPTVNALFSPNQQELDYIRGRSETYAGWSRERIAELQRQNSEKEYTIDYSLLTSSIYTSGRHVRKAFAYAITAWCRWDIEEVAYEDVFDSYTMDMDIFLARMGQRLEELNDNDEGKVYRLMSDGRNYYQSTDERKIKGMEAATISVTCHDGMKLSSGTTQYKCGTCTGSLTSHTRECAMHTTIPQDHTDTSDLEREAEALRDDIAALEEEIRTLESENMRLSSLILLSLPSEARELRQQISANKEAIARRKALLEEKRGRLKDLEKAVSETQAGEAVPTDDYYRLPAIMAEMETTFSLTWKDGGSWNGYTFQRKATLPGVNGEITFTATLSIARKPQYFLGIKIHRAIVQIAYELTGAYSDTHVAEVVTLDPSMTDSEKAALVNDRISQIALQYPSCDVSVEYRGTGDVTVEERGDTFHLLLASDRLELAREIDARLTAIYSDLVSLEKMLFYKRGIVDVIRSTMPLGGIMADRHSIAEECHDRWLEKAALRDTE